MCNLGDMDSSQKWTGGAGNDFYGRKKAHGPERLNEIEGWGADVKNCRLIVFVKYLRTGIRLYLTFFEKLVRLEFNERCGLYVIAKKIERGNLVWVWPSDWERKTEVDFR